MRSLAGWLLLALLAGLFADVRVSAQEPTSDGVGADAPTTPVTIDGVRLFELRGVSSFPAPLRARRVRERILALAADERVPIESIHIVESENTTRIVGGGVALLLLVDADAEMEQLGRSELAGMHMTRIVEAVTAYRAARSPEALRRSLLNIGAATLGVVLLLVVLFWFWRRVDARLKNRLYIPSVGIQSFEVMRADRLRAILRSLLFAFRAFLLLGVALLYFGYLLSQFPATRGLSTNMAALVLSPLRVMADGLVAEIPSLIFLAVLYFIVRLGLRLLRLFFDAVGEGRVAINGFDAVWAEPTYKLARVAVVAFAVVVAFPYIPGSDTDAFRGVSLFIGVVFSIGSSTAISNLVAGYMLTYRRAMNVGDRVRIGSAVGDVVAMRMQVTHLRSFKNEEIIIPNSQILGAEVMNYSSLAKDGGLILHTEVGIGYQTPWRQVEAMLLMAADRTEGLAKEPRPFVFEKSLGEFAVVYEINAYTQNVKSMGALYAELHRQILDVFNEYGVQIMTPAYEGDTPEPKVVAKQDWFRVPSAATRVPGGRS
jgi:small-conductance mechanosensitive channel